MNTKCHFRDAVSDRLRAAGITIKQVAQDMNVSERQAWNIFHGKHMTLESAALVARYLNTSIDDVYLATRGAA